MPIDPSTAESLTYEEARALVALARPIHLPAFTHLCPGTAAVLASSSQGIVFRNLKALTVAAAKALAPHQWGLHLHGLVSVSRELGDALAGHVGPIEFGASLKRLHSPLLAKKIAKQARWQIVLDGLESISPEIARAIAYHGSRSGVFPAVSLNGLRSLSAEVAAELAEAFDLISLNGLGDGRCILEEGAADALAAKRGYADRLLLAVEDVAGFLSQDYPAELLRRGILALNRSDDRGQNVCQFLDLDSLTSLNPKQAAAIAVFDGFAGISLRGLRTLSEEAAAALSRYQFDIEFDAGITLSPQAKAALGWDSD